MMLRIAIVHQKLLSNFDLLPTSSLAGARMGRGMFYGVGAAAAGPVCPFPEEWQQTIPECIENDDDID